MEQKERAQRCFVSYLRSVYLMKNKKVFDVLQLKLHDYALSLGLAVAPRVRFLNKAQVLKKEQGQAAPEQSEDVELKQFKAKLCGKAPSGTEPKQTEPEEDEEESTAASLFVGAAGNDEGDDDDDLREVDLLTVKRRDVFSLSEDQEGVGDEELDMPKGKKLTTLSEAKKILKRKFKVNTKITFSEEGDLVQQWPIIQRSAVKAADEELEEEFSGINVEKARERLKREDQEFDKQEYNRKIKERKRERRLKEKAARREASKRSTDKSDEEEEEEEEETVAYLDHSGEEFDPSTLPDPDKPNLKPSTDASINTSGESSSEEDDSSPANKRKRLVHHQPLDTGLSLAEDEELVLRLLGSS